MSSLRTPSGTERIASDTQPSGTHNEKDVVQNVGGMLWNGAGWVPAQVGHSVDGSPVENAMPVQNLLLNQSGGMDRQRNNLQGIAIAEGSYTTLQNSEIIRNWNHSKLVIYLHILEAGSGTLRLSFLNEEHTEITFPPCTGVDQHIAVAPGLATNSGETVGELTIATMSANMIVPANFSFRVTPSGATSWKYFVAYDLLV